MAKTRVIDDAASEAPPESDRLADWPHPRETPLLYGHDGAEREAVEAAASGRLHHGWLITGEEGIGKASFAYRFAKFLLSQAETLDASITTLDSEDGRTARQIAGLSHPGLFVVRRGWDQAGKKFRQTVAIEDVRQLRHFLQHTAVTPWRVVIVDSADDLNPNSANAILKSLEEPPPRTVFLIVSASPGRLVPTIRSRCRMLRLEPLCDGDLESAVAQACALSGRPVPGADEMRALGAWGRGSPRRVLQLLDKEGLAVANVLTALFASLPVLDRSALQRLIGLTGRLDSEAYTIAFDLIEELLADAARASVLEQDTGRLSQLSALGNLMTPHSLADWSELWETIREARGEAERLNLDKAALMLTVFDKIERTAKAAARQARG